MIGLFKRLWNRWQNRSRKIVASYEVKVVFRNMNNREEIITYFLFETPRGKRSWTSHSYGLCKDHDMIEQFAQAVIIWELGGVMPESATLYNVQVPTQPQNVAGCANQPDDKIIPFKPKKDK